MSLGKKDIVKNIAVEAQISKSISKEFLNKFLDYIKKNSKKEIVILAPTAIAALNVDAKTIHSFFNLPFHVITDHDIKKHYNKRLINKTEVVYPSIHKEKKIYKKEKKITFVGKLNESKGYDIYRDAVVKILNEFKDWKAYSIGDESRSRPIINHESHFELGFLKHKKVLDFLNKSEIAVVPSRWEEPFGRTALESSSRACATIISNRGGLTETTDHCVVLKKLTSNELYLNLKKLIKNNKLRKKIQNEGFKKVKHRIKDNSIFILSLIHI